eukprot:CAMPEP_0172674690 /NCGR_PEP_ID=MMETSP1074-20121228/12870_1 /TAXON_ID=2916 /ORGANISM="Ceratium fusus, Strain PA161109" /LENGTH=550 /DNA_ID=CAMNT_0013492117 /DNA_START=51 /DNA_END=1699 /DNA_ORIENTATION=+
MSDTSGRGVSPANPNPGTRRSTRGSLARASAYVQPSNHVQKLNLESTLEGRQSLRMENARLRADFMRSQSQLESHESRHAAEVTLLQQEHRRVSTSEEAACKDQESEIAVWKNIWEDMETRIYTEEAAISVLLLQKEALRESELKLKHRHDERVVAHDREIQSINEQWASELLEQRVICQRLQEENNQATREFLEIGARDESLMEAARQFQNRLEAKRSGTAQREHIVGAGDSCVSPMHNQLRSIQAELVHTREELGSLKLASIEQAVTKERAQLQALTSERMQRSAQGEEEMSEFAQTLREGERRLVELEDARERFSCHGSRGQEIDAARVGSPRTPLSHIQHAFQRLQQDCTEEIQRLSISGVGEGTANLQAMQELRDLQQRLEVTQLGRSQSDVYSNKLTTRALQDPGSLATSMTAVSAPRYSDSCCRSLEMVAEVSAGPSVTGQLGFAFEALPPAQLLVKQVRPGTWAAEEAIEEGDELLEVNGVPVNGLNAADFTALMAARPLSLRLWRCKFSPSMSTSSAVSAETSTKLLDASDRGSFAHLPVT